MLPQISFHSGLEGFNSHYQLSNNSLLYFPLIYSQLPPLPQSAQLFRVCHQCRKIPKKTIDSTDVPARLHLKIENPGRKKTNINLPYLFVDVSIEHPRIITLSCLNNTFIENQSLTSLPTLTPALLPGNKSSINSGALSPTPIHIIKAHSISYLYQLYHTLSLNKQTPSTHPSTLVGTSGTCDPQQTHDAQTLYQSQNNTAPRQLHHI